MKSIIIAVGLLVIVNYVHAQWNPNGATSGNIYYNNGNVGIGTDQPGFKLHIRDENGGDQLKFQRGTGVATITQEFNKNNLYIDAPAGLMLNYGGGNVGIGTGVSNFKLHIKDGNGGDQLKFQRGTGVATITQDNNQNDLYIDAPAGLMLNYSGGNVGIGTVIPNFKLHIKDGNGGDQLKFQRGTGVATITQDNNQNDLYIDAPAGLMLNYSGGNVGIGTVIPNFKLHIKDGNGGDQLKFQRGTGVATITQNYDKNDLYIDASSGLFLNYGGGNVGIGTHNASQKLTVNGTVYSTEVKVDVNAGTGPDYVFEPSYNLPTLAETEAYIRANKHLPEVPSAKEMEANGINLSEMNMLLLKKVEELTLHLIEQQKQITEQLKQNAQQQSEIELLKSKIK